MDMSAGRVLSPTSEWLVVNTGLSRSRYAQRAIKQLVSSILGIFSYYVSHPELNLPAEVLLKVQELCIPIANNPEALPLVEALVRHCRAGKWKMMATSTPVSPTFLQAVTQLQRPTEGYDKSPKLLLSYDVKVTLWVEHTPAFEQELLDMTKACTLCSDQSLPTLLNIRDLPKACAENPELLSCAEEFFRELISTSPETSRIFHAFHQEVSRYKPKVAASNQSHVHAHTYNIQLPCLHI